MNIKCFTVYICSINCPRVKWCPITLVTIQIIPYFEMNLIWSETYTPKNNYENTASEETEQTINQMTILLSWLLHIQDSFWKKNEFAIITHDINKKVSAPRSSHCDSDRQTVKRQLRDRQTVKRQDREWDNELSYIIHRTHRRHSWTYLSSREAKRKKTIAKPSL